MAAARIAPEVIVKNDKGLIAVYFSRYTIVMGLKRSILFFEFFLGALFLFAPFAFAQAVACSQLDGTMVTETTSCVVIFEDPSADASGLSNCQYKILSTASPSRSWSENYCVQDGEGSYPTFVSVDVLVEVGAGTLGCDEEGIDACWIQYTVEDISHNTFTGNVAVMDVAFGNTAPVATNGLLSVVAGEAKTGMLQATDIDGGTLTYTFVAGSISDTTKGTLAVQPNGSYTYTANAGVSGSTVTFLFTAADTTGLISNNATVTITITSPGAPIAQNDGPYSLAKNKNLIISVSALLANDTNANGTPITTESIDSFTQPANGAISLSGIDLLYTPTADFIGNDSFTYKVKNADGVSGPATVSISVMSPGAVADNISINEDNGISFNPLENDTNPDGTFLSDTGGIISSYIYSGVTHIDNDGYTGVNGWLQLQPGNKSFSYLPKINYFGTDSFTYIAQDKDGTLTQSVTVIITIKPVNDAPVAQDGALSVIAGSSGTQTLIANDVEGNALTYALVAGSISDTTKGTLVVQPNGSYTYTANAGASGSITFRFKVTDNGIPNLISNEATITVVIGAEGIHNRVALQTIVHINEDSGSVVVPTRGYDEYAHPLTFTLTALPSHGAVSSQSGNKGFQGYSLAYDNPTQTGLSWDLGSAGYEFTVPQNGYITKIGAHFGSGGGSMGVFLRQEGLGELASVVVPPRTDDNGWSRVGITPVRVYAGSTYIIYMSQTLGTGDTRNQINLPSLPYANLYETGINITRAFTGGEGGPSTGSMLKAMPDVEYYSDDAWPTRVTYTPNANYNGWDSFGFYLSDGTHSNTATSWIYVDSVADSPIVNAGPDLTVNEKVSVLVSGSFASDLDGGTLVYSWSCPGLTVANSTTFNPIITAPSVTADTLYICVFGVSDPALGMVTDTIQVTVKNVDDILPVVSANNASSSWFASRNVTVSVSDAGGSGLEKARYGWDSNPMSADCRSGGTTFVNGDVLTVSAGSHRLYLCARDGAGNTNTWDSEDNMYKVDNISPTSSFISPTPVASSWNNSLSVSVDDNDEGGSELAALCLTYVNSNNIRTATIWRVCDTMPAITVGPSGDCRDQGNNMCEVYSIPYDNAGNSGFAYRRFSVDYTAPAVKTLFAQKAVTKDKPVIVWTAEDTGGSGLGSVEMWRTVDKSGAPDDLAWTSLSGNAISPFTDSSISADGVYWYGVHVDDNAGNCITEEGKLCDGTTPADGITREDLGPIKVVVDKTAPVTTLTSVAGDVSSPFWDKIKNAVNTAPVVIKGEAGMKCRFAAVDAPYSQTPTPIIWWNNTGECSIAGDTATCNLTAHDGEKSGYLRYVSCKDAAENEQTAGQNLDVTFGVDWTKPTGSISINGGDGETNSSAAALTLSCVDAVSKCSTMQFSNDGTTFSAEEPFASSKPWSLDGTTQGAKTVYVKYRDNAGNLSGSFLDSIILDSIAPTVTAFSVNGISCTGAGCLTTAVSANVALNIAWTATDTKGSGVQKHELWRAPDVSGSPGLWAVVPGKDNLALATTSTTDNPADGTYWYGIHTLDNANNCITEAATFCSGGVLSDSETRTVRGPIKVIMKHNENPDVPSDLLPVSGTWVNVSKPTLLFTLSDPNAGDTVKYQIQIDTKPGFNSLVVDYTSVLGPQGSASFTIGQAVAGGSYAVGNAGQSLVDGIYYWQVKAIDSNEAQSEYAASFFKVDATSPTISIDPASGISKWQKDNAMLKINCTDPGGSKSSGCDTPTYRLKVYTSAPTPPGTCPPFDDTYNISPNEGTTDAFTISNHVWVCAGGKDKAGNTDVISSAVEFKVDGDSPSTGVVSPVAGEWFKDDFNVTFADSDIGGSLLVPGNSGCQYRFIGLNSSINPKATCNGLDDGSQPKDCTSGDLLRQCGSITENITVGTSPNVCRFEGLNRCRVETRSFDGAGNDSGWQQRSFGVDFSTPTINAPSPTVAQVGVSTQFMGTSLQDAVGHITGCTFYTTPDHWTTWFTDSAEVSVIPNGDGESGGVSADHTFATAGSYEARFSCSDAVGHIGWGAVSSIQVGTLSVTAFSAMPPAGSVNTDFDFKTVVSGTMLGTTDFSFDCENNGSWEYQTTGVNLSVLDPGFVARDGKQTQVSPAGTFIVQDVCKYTTLGTKTAQVFVSRGAGVAQKTVDIVISTNTPPEAINLLNNNETVDYCFADNPPVTLSWEFSDADGDKQTAYHVQIATNLAFSPTVIDTGKVENSNAQYAPPSLLYGATYYWRVKVWDAADESLWVTRSAFTTKVHKLPVPDFTFSPLSPSANEQIQFCSRLQTGICSENNTLFASGSTGQSFSWNFGDTKSSSSQNPTHAYDANGQYEVILTATDDAGSCENKNLRQVNVALPFPSWLEISPF